MPLSKDQKDELQSKPYEPLYITAEGLAALKDRLARLKRNLPAQALETQRTAAYGDRSENEEYKQAKGTLRRMHAQILTIEDQLKRAIVIKPGTKASGKIELGSTVVLETSGAQKIFQIVGPHETDPEKGRISHLSPLGAALMGRAPGETIVVKAGAGSRSYLILEIK